MDSTIQLPRRPLSAASSRMASVSTLSSRGDEAVAPDTLAMSQSSLSECRGARGASISSKLSDRVQRAISADEAKIGMLSEQVTRLRENLHSDKVAAELLDERLEKDIKLIESSVELDLDALTRGRKESLAKLEKAANNTIAEMTQECKARQEEHQRRKKEMCRQVAEGVMRLTAETEKLTRSRVVVEEKIRESIEANLARISDGVAAERKARAASEGKMLKRLEEICGRVLGDIQEERQQRRQAEEHLISLLEDTCVVLSQDMDRSSTLIMPHHHHLLASAAEGNHPTSFLAGIWPNKCKFVRSLVICRPRSPPGEPSYVEPSPAPMLNSTKVGVPKICGAYEEFYCPPGAKWPEGFTRYPDPAKDTSTNANVHYSAMSSWSIPMMRMKEFEGKMLIMREEVEDTTLDNQRLAHEVLRLQRLLKAEEEEREQLKAKLADVTDNCKEADGRAGAMQSELDTARKATQDMKLELDRCQSRVEALKTDLGAQRKARAKLEATVEALKGAVVTENTDKSTASRELDDANKRIAQLQKEKDKADGQLKKMITMVRALEDTQGTLLSELEATTGKLLDVGKNATSSEEANVEALRKAAEQQQEVVRMRAAMLTLDRERDELQFAVDAKSEEISTLRSTNRELTERVGEMNRKVEQLRREAEGQQVDLNSMDEETSALQRSIVELQEETVRLRTELDGSQQEARNITEDLTHMTRENQSLHAEVIRLSRETTELRTLVEQHKRETQSAALRAVELERDDVRELYHQATLDGHRRSASISTLQEERDQLEETLDLLTKENEKFQSSLGESFKQNRRLQMDLDATEEQNQELLRQLREMDELLAEQRRMAAMAGDERNRAEDACRQLSTAGNHQSREAAKLATHLAAVTAENQRLTEKLREARHALHEESNRSHQLEDYLNDQRRRQAIGVVSPLHPSASDSSFSIQSHPEYMSLCDTVEQQYKLIGEMDSTLVQLQQENAELKSMLGH
ncbi:hypothetical protein FOL47_000033 [Perkinsus chesapeaki]|uniref:Uncharacterized protein n=1 Tax=Perkinsus chesapeaki TaxID=330153 RepID=A0A7J6N3S3_PERCH|nr:hypothetical protein FOL47_000033 [Perkinsus chesapeaki]